MQRMCGVGWRSGGKESWKRRKRVVTKTGQGAGRGREGETDCRGMGPTVPGDERTIHVLFYVNSEVQGQRADGRGVGPVNLN